MHNTVEIFTIFTNRDFWVSWEGANITLGQGRAVGQNSFLSYKDNDPHEVHSVSLTSGYHTTERSNGTFIIRRDEGLCHIHCPTTLQTGDKIHHFVCFLPALMSFAWTPAEFYYGRVWITNHLTTYFQFGLKTCNDGLLALADRHSDVGRAYELVIGQYVIKECQKHE